METYKKLEDSAYDYVTLVMESPNGHREYEHGLRWNMEMFLEGDAYGYIIDRYGFKWKAWIEN